MSTLVNLNLIINCSLVVYMLGKGEASLATRACERECECVLVCKLQVHVHVHVAS
jgi:hypothetical protein